jgi:hypothetical protein
MIHKFCPAVIGYTSGPKQRPIFSCKKCKIEMYIDADGKTHYRDQASIWRAAAGDDPCLGSGLSKQIGLMLDLRNLVLTAFTESSSVVNNTHLWGFKLDYASIDDRRMYFWSLTDNDQSLVYSTVRNGVVDMTEDTFVDTVHHIWRPEGEEFVILICNNEIDRGDTIVFLARGMEQRVLEGNT